MTIKVIGAGLGRTGTASLKLALEQLGFGSCYHMGEVLAHLEQRAPLWVDAMVAIEDDGDINATLAAEKEVMFKDPSE